LYGSGRGTGEGRVKYSLGLNALPVDMTEFDHKGPEIISEHRNGYSIGSPVWNHICSVGPIVALLDVRPDFVLREGRS
jgi:hypothetical protein